jgi:hypothetical protein
VGGLCRFLTSRDLLCFAGNPPSISLSYNYAGFAFVDTYKGTLSEYAAPLNVKPEIKVHKPIVRMAGAVR